VLETRPEDHRRLFHAFTAAMVSGDEAALQQILADDVVLVVDPGPATHYGRMRALGHRPSMAAMSRW